MARLSIHIHMAQFNGTIRLEDGEGLETTMTVDGGRLVATAGALEIGDWAVGELAVVRRNNEFRIKVEGEELIVGVTDPVGFSQTLGLRDGKPAEQQGKKSKATKPKRKERSRKEGNAPAASAAMAEAPAATASPSPVTTTRGAPATEQAPSLFARIPVRWKLACLGFVGLVAFFFIDPNLLALVLLLGGVATLFLAIASKSESGTGIMPPPFFATTAAVAGGVASVLVSLLIMATR